MKLSTVILVGGLGSRLRPAYSSGPKCMVPVGGRRFLEYLLSWLRSAGVREAILCLGHKRAQLQRWLGDGSKWGFRFVFSVETELLGTAGAIKKAQEFISSSTFLVLNGDSFLDLDLDAMFDFHRRSRGLATMAVAHVADASRFGSLRLNECGQVTAFIEKGKLSEGNGKARQSQLINAGMYLMQTELLKSLPAEQPVSLEKDVFPNLVGRGLYGFVSDGYFVDIGTPEDLLKAQTELPNYLESLKA